MPPHKPLFLMAGLWALVAPSVWLWPGLVADPVAWHLHEFFFGMAAAAIGGYLLTALPHWATGDISPVALRLLILFWLAGRIAQIWPQTPGALVLAVAYPLFLCLLLARGLIPARAWRRMWMAGLPLALATAEMLTAYRPGWSTAPVLLTLGFTLMIGLIGGRIVPAFTRSRLRHIAPHLTLQDLRSAGWVSAIAAAAAPILLGMGHDQPTGLAILIAGTAQIIRQSRWRPLQLRTETDILMMQGAFALLAFGQILVGLALIRPEVLALRAALHMLTMGAMGGMILAIASRPLLPRANGRLQPGRDIDTAFLLICAAGASRVFLANTDIAGLTGQHWSALFWLAAWALFLLRSLRLWKTPAPFPALSADQGKGG